MSRKVGICVGQNNYSPASGVTPLGGCVNDALLIGEMLRTAGFEVRQIHDQAATQRGILDALETEVATLRKDDYLAFWNSSHGFQVQDQSGGDEFDYKDEAICCYDNNYRDALRDDKFARILNRAHPEATIFFGSDSCHSGTVTKALVRELAGLPPDESAQARPRSDDAETLSFGDIAREILARDPAARSLQFPIEAMGAEAREMPIVPDNSDLAPADSDAEPAQQVEVSINDPVSDDWQVRLFIPNQVDVLFDLGQNVLNLDDYVRAASQAQRRVNLDRFLAGDKPIRRLGALARPNREETATHVLLSGCLPEEVSWDAPFPQGRHGAMTYYFAVVVLEAWKRGEAITYQEAHQEATNRLLRRFSQHPQLEGPDSLKNAPVFGYEPS
jgi:hypothetical protein